MSAKPATAAVILAAGEASRMGQPKQLLKIGRQSLIHKAIDTAHHAHCHPTVIVLGAHAASVQEEIKHTAALPVLNEQWQQGMGSSIRTGIRKVLEVLPGVDAVIIMLCDQPLVTPALLMALMQAHSTSGKPIAACRYKDTLGVPALFHRSFFDQLLVLSRDAGARKLIRQHATQVAVVPFEKGAVDLDTPEDYEDFQKLKGNGFA